MKNFLGIGILKIVSTVGAFVTTVLLASKLGAAKFGTYSVILAYASTAMTPIIRGFPTLLVRTSSQESDEITVSSLFSLLKIADLVGLTVAFITFCILVITISFTNWIPEVSFFVVACACLAMYLVLVTNSRSAITWGKGNTLLGHMPDQVFRPSAHLLILTAFIFLISASIELAMIALVLASLISAVAAGFILKRTNLQQPRLSLNPSLFSFSVVKAVWPLSFIAGLQMLNNQLDLLVLAANESITNVGIYKFALAIGNQVGVGLMLVTASYSPVYARLYKLRDMQALKAQFENASRMAFLFGLLLLLIMIPTVTFVIPSIVSHEYIDSVYPTLAVAVINALSLKAGGANALLLMAKQEKNVGVSIVIATFVKVVALLLFVPTLGLWGAILATGISLSIWRVTLTKSVNKLLSGKSN
jgi:O-antigen/teichoic acid export membrane protein